MIKYEKPIIKKPEEMERGDIFRAEYGDYGNWCNFVFESCKIEGKRLETQFHWIGKTESEKCYEWDYRGEHAYEVIGKE